MRKTPHVLAVSRPRALPRANPEPIPAGGRRAPRLTAAVRGGTRPSPARALPETTSRRPRRVSGNIRARVSCPHRRERRVGVGTRLAKRIPANCFSLKSAGSSRHKNTARRRLGLGEAPREAGAGLLPTHLSPLACAPGAGGLGEAGAGSRDASDQGGSEPSELAHSWPFFCRVLALRRALCLGMCWGCPRSSGRGL